MELESIGRKYTQVPFDEESATRRPGRDGWVEYQLCRCAGAAGRKIPSLETFIVLLNALEVSSDMVLSSLLVEKHQADASRLMDRMQNLPAYDIERILAVVDDAYTVFKYGSRVSYCFFF